MEDLKVIGWISFDSNCDNILIDSQDTFNNVLSAVIDEIKAKGYCFAGDEHQNHPCGVPLFNNGKCLRCSMRMWGNIMSIAIDNEANYTNYYCKDTMIKESIFPICKDSFAEKFIKGEDSLPQFTKIDIDMIVESLSLDMPFITFDKVLNQILPIIEKQYKENQNG